MFTMGVPWVLPVVVVGLLVAAFAVRLSWAGALGAATVVTASALACVMAMLPRLNVSLTIGMIVLLVALGVGSIAWLLRAGGPRLPDRDALWTGAAILVAPMGVGLIALVGRARDAGVSWAMWNDGIYHLTGTRQILVDGGLIGSRGNRDPLANEVLALATTSGRASVDLGDLLAFDVGRQALVIVLLLVWMGVLASAIISTAIPPRHRYVRAAVAVGAGLLPWTWFISGFALRFGWTNALVSIVVLLAAWLVWSEAPTSPIISSALLMLAAVACLAAWAVIAVVPMAWGAWVIWRSRLEHLALRRGGAAAWLTILAVSAAYALWITAPSVSPSGEIGLTAEGAFFQFAPLAPSIVLAALLALSVLTTRSTGDTWSRTGVIVFGSASLLGQAALLRQRIGTEGSFWGYYPQKYAWVLCVLAIIMIARFMAQAVSVDLSRSRDRLAAPIVIVGAGLAIMLVAPPGASPLVATGVRQVAPALTIVDGVDGNLADDLGYLTPTAPVLFAQTGPGRTVLLSRYLTDSIAEEWVNEWTVQLAEPSGGTMSRRDVQRLDLREPAEMCELLATSNRPVTVLSGDPGFLKQARDRCPTETVVWALVD